MAIVASDLPMATHQFVVRVYVMVKQWRVPIIIAVAGNALTAVMSVVLVVFQVAGYAHLFHFVLERVFRMAVVAGQCGVLALKWKFGVARMIETRVVPVAGVVAIFALLAAAAIVCIIFGVTVKARRGCIQERMVFVAVQTGGLLVFAEQWVVGCIVVEFGVRPFS